MKQHGIKGKLLLGLGLLFGNAVGVLATTTKPALSLDATLTAAISDDGVVVERVREESPAAEAGLRAGDRLVNWRLNGTDRSGRFTSILDVIDFTREVMPHGEVRIAFMRDSVIQDVHLNDYYMGLRVRPRLSDSEMTAYQRYKDALDIEAFSEAVAIAKNRAAALHEKGRVYHAVWFMEKAMAVHFRRQAWDAVETVFHETLLLLEGAPRKEEYLQRLLEIKMHMYARAHEYGRTMRILEALHAHMPEDKPFTRSMLLTMSGKYARLAGNLTQAERFLHDGVMLAESLPGENLYLAYALTQQAALAQATNDQKTAEDNLNRAYRIAEQTGPRSFTFAETLNQMGRLHYVKGNLLRSKDYFTREWKLRRALSPNSSSHHGALNGLGAVAWASDKTETAFDYIRQAVDLLKENEPRNLMLAKVLGNLAYMFLMEEQPEAAFKTFTEAAEILDERAPDNLLLADMLYGAGRAQYDLENLDKSLNFFDQGMEMIEAQLARFVASEDVRANYSAKYRRLFAYNIGLLVDTNRTQEAFNVLERYHARVFLDMLGERDLMYNLDFPEDLQEQLNQIAASSERYQKELDQLPEGSPDRKRKLDAMRHLRTARADLYDQVKQGLDRPIDCDLPAPLTTEQIRANLKPGSLLLSYLVQNDRIFLFTLAHDRDAHAVEIKIEGEKKRDALEKLVQDYRRFLMKPDNKAAVMMMANKSRELYRLLIEPVADQIARYDRLLVIPDGPLRILPFSALHNGKQYLTEQLPTTMLNSASVFHYLGTRKLRDQSEEPTEQKGEENDKSWYAFGAPEYDTKPTPTEDLETTPGTVEGITKPTSMFRSPSKNFGELAYSRDEVEFIGRRNRKTTVLTGPDASEFSAMQFLDESASVIHFSCHGFYDEDYPLNSALALSSGPDGEDGYLHAWEVMDNYALDADMVVLAACESGLGKDFGADGLLGLTRAFQYAGAQSVVASLWRVSDLSTAYLMKKFYRFMGEGQTRAQALRSAQMDMISKSGNSAYAKFSHPFYWAGFQLHGHWEKIEDYDYRK